MVEEIPAHRFPRVLGAHDPEQSGQLFDQRVADPSIPKEHLPGNEVRIAVMDIPRSTMELQRELEITVGSVGQLDSAAAAADA